MSTDSSPRNIRNLPNLWPIMTFFFQNQPSAARQHIFKGKYFLNATSTNFFYPELKDRSVKLLDIQIL